MASRGQKAIQRARQAMFVTFSHYGELAPAESKRRAQKVK